MSQGRRDKIWCEKCFNFRFLVAVHPMGHAPGVLKGNVRIETFTAGSVVCTVAVATAAKPPAKPGARSVDAAFGPVEAPNRFNPASPLRSRHSAGNRWAETGLQPRPLTSMFRSIEG